MDDTQRCRFASLVDTALASVELSIAATVDVRIRANLQFDNWGWKTMPASRGGEPSWATVPVPTLDSTLEARSRGDWETMADAFLAAFFTVYWQTPDPGVDVGDVDFVEIRP